MKSSKMLHFPLLLMFLLVSSSQAHAELIKVFLNRAYEISDDVEKNKIKQILTDVMNEGLAPPEHTIDIEWLQYEGAMDITRETRASFGIITTGMYARIQHETNQNSAVRIMGIVNKFGTTTYKYFILAKSGTELKPDLVKGRIVMKKKQSLSGSVFPWTYLVENHGFDERLLDNDQLREEWGTTERFHDNLTELDSSTAQHLLYFGEGLASERPVYERNGWDVYPLIGEVAADFEITRSLVFTHKLQPEIASKLQVFFHTPSEDRDYILGAFGIDGIEAVDFTTLSNVVEKYAGIFGPDTGFEELYKKIEQELGLYTIALALMLVAHLLFRYRVAAKKDNLFWMSLTLIFKFSFFVVAVWTLPNSAVYFIPAAIVIGATEKSIVLDAMKKAQTALP